MSVLFYISIILISGLVFGRLAKLIKLPNVTGYIFAGLIIGPYVLKLLNTEVVESFAIVPDMALAFIAFTIGLTFKISYFKRVGFTPVVIAFMEAVCAVVLVQAVLVMAGFDTAYAIVLGAIAAATAPAATIMVIKQYKARGPVSETLLSVVAIDDAVALMAFGFAVTIAKAITGTSDENFLISILSPLWEVVLALLIGAAVGILIKVPLRFFKKSGNRLIIIICFVFLSYSLADFAGVSNLLACMMTGAVFCNISSESESINDLADSITPPLFLMFFVISGAQLNIKIIPQIGLVGVIYVAVRVVGKICGAYLGGKMMHAPKEVCRYLGPSLIPQAGVAIGLTTVAQSVVPEYAASIRAVILCGTLIYEIIGPAVTKITLTKAGEIKDTRSTKKA